ncbi:hypothetical protein [Bacillus sp. B1-b2]|uniref:hypothetical protein n=1 Tax=Bacillus sp. B1-b2 TaxID=2653201 RepID=UPI0012620310|nr:hypothetical protein [Bacillus sp. B1-b2]KAB7672938.1 hypothetical protein F9279_00490 [Bacillus sp. B1-b2]
MCKYIIENTHILKRQTVKKTSLLIEDNRIELIRNSFQQYRYMRMDGSPFIMTPTSVILDNQVVKCMNRKEQKQYIEENIIKKGCTTILCYVELKWEKDWLVNLRKMRSQLVNSSIDYVIGVKVALKRLTPSFARLCKKEKIPVIFVEVEEGKELYDIPWGWIKDSLFPYNAPLVPVFTSTNEEKKKLAQSLWSRLMRDIKIPSVQQELENGIPLSYEILVKTGIYPFKGSINQGGEVSYNLLPLDSANRFVDESELFLYHYDSILATIHKGTCIRALDKVFYRPGYGEQLEVKVPSFLRI